MADPLSITASIIAVVGAAEGVTKTLRKIRNIRNAPEELLALVREISDIRTVIGDIDNYIQKIQKSQDTTSPATVQPELQHLVILVTRAKGKLLELDQLVQYRLMKPESIDDHIRVSRREWAGAKHIIEGFRRSLRDIRFNIVTQMMVINSSHQSRIGLTINEIHLISDQIQSNQLHAESRTAKQLKKQSHILTNILNSQSSLHHLLSAPIHSRTWTQGAMVSPHQQPLNRVVRVKASYGRRWLCAAYCKCACHVVKTFFQSPALLKQVIGTLIIGYAGYPIRWGTPQPCTESSCLSRRKIQATVKYLFPAWLIEKAFFLRVTAQQLGEIKVSLKVQRIVPIESEVFRLIFLPNGVDRLRALFRKGQASPNDVAPELVSVLRIALTYRNFQVVEFLLQAGADPWLETDKSTASDFHFAWNMIFEASDDKVALRTLRELLPNTDDSLEERQFSQLHEIILGIRILDLEQHLAMFRGEINTVDINGMTPLMWAARRGDSSAVELLLKANADFNIKTRLGGTALGFAARSSSVACMRLFLAVGADSIPANSYNLNLLHCVAEGKPTEESSECVDIIVAGGVDINQQNCWGITPLVTAAGYHNCSVVAALLNHDAEINRLSPSGDSALNFSIICNANDITKLLLLRGADYTSIGSYGSVLHATAMSGNLKTVEIMLAAGLHGINPDAVNCKGKTAMHIAQERDDKPDGFVERFESLLAVIRARNASRNSANTTSEQSHLQRWPRLLAPLDGLLRFSSIWTYRILGLFVAVTVYSLATQEINRVQSLLEFIWDMLDPSDLEYV